MVCPVSAKWLSTAGASPLMPWWRSGRAPALTVSLRRNVISSPRPTRPGSVLRRIDARRAEGRLIRLAVAVRIDDAAGFDGRAPDAVAVDELHTQRHVAVSR